MRKTSVYLTDEEAERLREAATACGRSQSELIREGIRYMLRSFESPERVFHSMGRGHSGSTPHRGWNSEALYKKVMGQTE